ncbi:MAG TPA: hypothetical protein VGJ20_26975 [Xanthobacteraceae bacterium]|jgi:hypothetical protein
MPRKPLLAVVVIRQTPPFLPRAEEGRQGEVGRESPDFTLKQIHAERVQIVNGVAD